MSRPLAFAVLAVLTFAAMSADAAPITFFGVDNPRPLDGTLPNSLQAETQFKAALGVFGTDNLEAQVVNNPTLVFGATGVTATTSNNFLAVSNPAQEAVSPRVSLQGRSGNEVFTFNLPVTGFGTYLVGLGTAASSNTLSFLLENTVLGTSQSVNVGTFGPGSPGAANGVAYFGLLDAASPFNRVTVQASNDGDLFFYDNLTAGAVAAPAAVPEPGTLALLVTGTVGLFARRRRA